MRNYLILFAITGAATKAAYFSGHPVQSKSAVTTLDPLTMHCGTQCGRAAQLVEPADQA
jgi:hypothetical protein